MTTLQTSFELSPAGTAIPTSGVAGDGDAFASGNDGTATFVSDSTTTAAVASGSFCGKITIGATASLCNRNWGLSTSTPSVRMYVYLTAYPNAALEIAGPVNSGTILSRIRINTNGSVSYTLLGAVQATTTGVIPLNTLVRIEANWSLSTTAGTCAVDVYSGHSTSPMANLSLSGGGMAMAAATCSSMRLGVQTAGPSSFTFYTDGWGIADTGRLGPITTPATVSGSTAVVRVRSAAGVAAAVQVIAGVTAVVRVRSNAGVATGSPVVPDWVGTDQWNPADTWPGPHGNAVLGVTAFVWLRSVAGAVEIVEAPVIPIVPIAPATHEWVMFARDANYAPSFALPIISASIVRRHLGVSRAVVKTPYTPEALAALYPPNGVLVYRDGLQEFTGLAAELDMEFGAEDGRDVITVQLVDDVQHLADRLSFPDPLRAADDQSVNDYWTTSGVASTAMRKLISDQAGPTARADRRVPNLALGADPGVGVSRSWSALFNSVLDQLTLMSIASGANLGVRMSTSPGFLTADIVAPRNLAGSVLFSTDLSNLAGVQYRIAAPTVTHALSAGQGDLHLRLRKLATTSDPLATMWGRQIWSYIDRRDTADVTELVQAASDALAEGGPTVSLAVTLLDSDAATYRTDWDVGDTVTVYVGRPGESKTAISDVVREVAIEVDESGREEIRPAVGSFDASVVPPSPTQQKLSAVGLSLAGLIARK